MTHAVPGHGTAAGIPPMAPVPQLIIAESGAIDHGRRHAPATSRPHQVGAEDAQKLPTREIALHHIPALVNEARRSETVSEVKDREYIQSYAFNVQRLRRGTCNPRGQDPEGCEKDYSIQATLG